MLKITKHSDFIQITLMKSNKKLREVKFPIQSSDEKNIEAVETILKCIPTSLEQKETALSIFKGEYYAN